MPALLPSPPCPLALFRVLSKHYSDRAHLGPGAGLGFRCDGKTHETCCLHAWTVSQLGRWSIYLREKMEPKMVGSMSECRCSVAVVSDSLPPHGPQHARVLCLPYLPEFAHIHVS